VSVSDLSEYAYCPRAFWYRHHPPSDLPTRATERFRAAGTQFHQRRLTADERFETWSDRWLVIALTVAGIVAAVALWLWWT
jgi:CRISPR/Cas system-associated exonuclease Cas4 (RecB family)